MEEIEGYLLRYVNAEPLCVDTAVDINSVKNKLMT